MIRFLAPLFIAVVLASGCAPTLEEFEALSRDAAACTAGDTCVLAGAGECTCDRPVNSKRADEMNSTAKKLNCNGIQVECVFFKAPHCDGTKCVADMQ